MNMIKLVVLLITFSSLANTNLLTNPDFETEGVGGALDPVILERAWLQPVM